ncbi:MAG: hypothetical protein B7Y88_05430 [Sphingomonadales bacterium 32-64-17]|nr:MAG: hypothetical protein B7Y88_05430 [Sphingomonadales bacterium 32-64-17]
MAFVSSAVKQARREAMEYELIDRSQHEPAARDKKHQRAIFIPDEDRESGKQEPAPAQMEG